MGIDMIPPKIVIMLKDDISYLMQSIANMMIDHDQSTFPDQAKISSVTPAFKKDEWTKWTKWITGGLVSCHVSLKY